MAGDVDEGPDVLARRRRVHQDRATTRAFQALVAAKGRVAREPAAPRVAPTAGAQKARDRPFAAAGHRARIPDRGPGLAHRPVMGGLFGRTPIG